MHHLLIVDDEEYMRNGLKKRFEWQKFGFEVIGTCRNGHEALEFIYSYTPHVVLTDIRMPGMDGLELASHLHRAFPQIHIILLSAYNEFKYAQHAIKAGVKGYLLKPAEEEEVRELFVSLAQTLTHTQGQPAPLIPSEAPPLSNSYHNQDHHMIALVKQYLEERIGQKITLLDVANKLHFSPAYFSVYFKKITGQNFIDFVNETKIRKAKQLLQASNYLVKDIANEVGYDDYSYFCKIFRKYTGQTPLDYRSSRLK